MTYSHPSDWSSATLRCVPCGLKVTAELSPEETRKVRRSKPIQRRLKRQLLTYFHQHGCEHAKEWA